MLRFSVALLFSLVAAAALAAVAFLLFAYMRGAIASFWPFRLSNKRLTSTDIYDLTRSTIATAGLAAGVFAAVYAYRKQRVADAPPRFLGWDSPTCVREGQTFSQQTPRQ
jgi:hypothetical protein